ncbi:CRISPR-associated endoribonuclease Cas6 [Desulfobacter vibrioformis]|uniref:CRISPR-associated endoribonuclease Cas6 n=1 Tax=Desulfobacter vibrioformis TaxID=34031 RepID=UPI00054D37A6|nr:CRISPR-associated endoribonuclease Cas6 [Desulfobacter vibrioformis]
MYRIRLTLPKRVSATYRNLDIIHDSLVHAWIDAGALPESVVGQQAGIWHFGVLGWNSKRENHVHTLVVGSPDDDLSGVLKKFDPSAVCYSRALTAEQIDFSQGQILEDSDPVGPGQSALGLVLLSPLAISRQARGKNTPRWHTQLLEADLSRAVSHRLSRLTGRDVDLKISPDHLYLRAHPKHDTLIQTKEMKNGRRAFVIGMRAPLVIQGSEEDLRLAWYAGIGEKNRSGFGCIGLAERGIGR